MIRIQWIRSGWKKLLLGRRQYLLLSRLQGLISRTFNKYAGEPGPSVESLAGVIKAACCYNNLGENDLVWSHDAILAMTTDADLWLA
jgi:hypothetical protein